MIRSVEIVGIFDLDGEITTADTKRFLRRIDAERRAELAGDDLPRSFVLISDKKNRDSVIYSRLTTQALVRRTQSNEKNND